MKELYRFTLFKEVTKEETQTAEDGTKTIKPVTVREPRVFIIKKPSRHEREEAQLYYGDVFRELAAPYDKEGKPKRHLLTKAELIRKYKDSGGTTSEEEKQYLAKLYSLLVEKKLEWQRLVSEKASEEQIAEVRKQWNELKRLAQEEQASEDALYSNTADTVAMQKTIIWLILNLTYIEENEKPKLYFEGTDEERADRYDEICESEDEFDVSLREKLLEYFTLVWLGASDAKPFEELEKTKSEELT